MEHPRQPRLFGFCMPQRFGDANAKHAERVKECASLPQRISPPTSKLAKEILSYFLRNPRAADSLEGVARWRLLDERVHRQIEATDLALGWLVQRGLLRRVDSAWTEAMYQLNEENRAEAERLVGETRKGERKPRRRS
jgi:hypothetical protein